MQVFFVQHREWVVGRNPLAKAFVVFKHWPVNDPEVIPLTRLNHVEFFGNRPPEVTQRISNDVEASGNEENQVAVLGTQLGVNLVSLVV